MTIKISELPSLESAALITTPTTVIPLVANIGENTTFITTIANVKSYVESGDFSSTGTITVGTSLIVTTDATVGGNLIVNGNLNITGANNLAVTDNIIELHVANTANIAEPWTFDDGKDIGIRLHWYGTQDQNAAFVFSAANRAFEFYDTGAIGSNVFTGNTYGTINAGQAKFVNTIPTTGNATGSLQTYGGMSATGSIWSGGNVTATQQLSANSAVVALDIRSTTSNTAGATQVGSLRSNSFATVHTTLVTGGTATVNAVNVNTAATIGTTLIATGGITGATITSNANVIGIGAAFSGVGVFASIQNTPVGSVTHTSGKFTTLTATGATTMDSTASVDGVLTTNGIVPFGNANANIGSTSNQYNVIFAQASRALYADLAEKYDSDAEYNPGTVVIFGGAREITVTEIPGDIRVAGAISTEPAYIMNSGSTGLEVALRGKIPVNVIGAVTKGDLLITSAMEGYACSIRRYPDSSPNAVFAKSLETNTSQTARTIWAVIV